MRQRVLALAAVLLASAGCTPEEQPDPLPPTDGFYFPIGLAVTLVHGSPELLVASSNFDLRYSAPDGGTLLALDPAAAIAAPGAWAPDGAVRIGSYAGAVAVADAASCPALVNGLEPSRALVASRYDDRVYVFELNRTSGALDPGAVLAAPVGYDDPFPIAVACGPAGTRAYVGYLDPPDARQENSGGTWLGEIDLATGGFRRHVELGVGPARGLAYDPVADRLWATTLSTGARALLHTVVLSDPRFEGPTPLDAVDTFDLFPLVHGAELRTIAVGTPPDVGVTRLFIAARLYDAEAQASLGGRPSGDVGGVLVVLDVAEGNDGHPVLSVRDVASLGTGVGDVAVVRRTAPGRDLVVVTARSEGLLFVYDDATGAFARVIDADAAGAPELGNRPLAVAVDQPAAGDDAQVYVGSFGDHLLHRFLLKPADPAASTPLELIRGVVP